MNGKFFVWIAMTILTVFIFLRFFSWIDGSPRSLLPANAMSLESFDVLETIIPLPTNTFGAGLYTAGLYTTEIGEIPEGTVVVVYVKDGWRFVEINYFPKVVATKYLATHIYPTQEIKLDHERSVWIQTIDTNPRCIDYEDDIPNRCEISRHLIADLDNRLVLIAADGNHPTDGELIEIARSIIDQKTNH